MQNFIFKTLTSCLL